MMLEIDDEAIDAIMLARLRQDRRMVLEDIEELQELAVTTGLERYQQEDLNDNLVIVRHLEAVLAYYGGSDWEGRIT